MESEASPTQPQPPPSPQPQSDGLIGLLAWAEVNKQRLAIGGGVVIVLIAVVALVVQQMARKEITASEALSDVRVPYNPALPAAAGTTDALLKMANEHSGTKAAARALLISGGILFTEKNYDEAQKRYAKLIQEYPASPWIPEANLGIASSLDAQGKSADAITKFEEIRKRFAGSPAAEDAKLGLARLYEAQKPEDAFKLYEEISKNNPNTTLAAEADFRKEELVRLRPELAKLNEPIAPALTPMPNAPAMMTNMVQRTNVQVITMTNRPGATGQPVQIKLNPSPAPAPPAASATPAPVPAK